MGVESNYNSIDPLRWDLEKYFLNLNSERIDPKELFQAMDRYEEETGEDALDLVNWEDRELQEELVHPIPIEERIVPGGGDPNPAINAMCPRDPGDFYFVPWYEGYQTIATYHDGYLQSVMISPDGKKWSLRTRELWYYFPKQVDGSIVRMYGFLIVDADRHQGKVKERIRELVKFGSEEANDDLFVRIYDVERVDREKLSEPEIFQMRRMDLIDLPLLESERSVAGDSEQSGSSLDTIFWRASMIRECPSSHVMDLQIESARMLVKGVIVYSVNGVFGCRVDFPTGTETEVLGIDYSELDSGSFSATVRIQPVTVGEISVVSLNAGGIQDIIREGLGAGAKITVKPERNERSVSVSLERVIQPSTDFQFPKCGCGHQLTEEDLQGQSLRCSSPEVCAPRVERFKRNLLQLLRSEKKLLELGTVQAMVEANPTWFGNVLGIDRWDPEKRKLRKIDGKNLTKSINDGSVTLYLDIMKSGYKFTNFQLKVLEANAASSLQALRELMEYTKEDILKEE